MKEDEHFITRLYQKDAGAFKTLFDDFYTPLVLYATRLLGSQPPAEDIVQELFSELWIAPKRYQSFETFRVYLYRALKNRCLDYLKHEEVKERYVVQSLQRDSEVEERDDAEIEEEVYRILFRSIEELPAGCRRVMEMHLEGKKNDEIATALQVSVLTVKSQKQKALRLLREKMGKYFVWAILMGLL